MKFGWICLPLSCGLLLASCHSNPVAQAPDDSGRLVTGKRISQPQQLQTVGSLPMNMIATPDNRFVLTSDMGYRESVWAIRMDDGQGVSSVTYSNKSKRKAGSAPANGEASTDSTPPGSPKSNGLYYGLAAAPNGTIFAAQGAHDSVAVLALDATGNLTKKGEIKTRKLDFPAGLALDSRGFLFVANNTSGGDNPLRSPGSIAIYDPTARAPTTGETGGEAAGKVIGNEVGRCELPSRYHNTSGFPLAICVFHDGSKAYVDSERDSAVYAIDTTDLAHPAVHATIDVGAHPVGMTLSGDEHLLFVANSESDSVSIIDTATDRQISTILLRPEQARGLPGATPVAVALSPNQKTLYAALADMNAIAEVNIADPKSPLLLGYISTGWYPSALLATPDGKRLLVADARGSQPLNPNSKLPSTRPNDRRSYILNIIEGDVRTITLPDSDGLRDATQKVLAMNSLPPPIRPSDQDTAEMGLKSGRIQHVFYIIKENRTYDQVLGDLPQGNGDSNLTIFGSEITPNLHALAGRFVLLDNLYACGEVSGDGWNWSTQGIADAYVSRNVPYNYSNRGRKFDFEAMNNGYPTGGFPTTGPDAVPATNPVFSQGGEAMPDVSSTGEHLWDAAEHAGVSLRNYGFFLYMTDKGIGIPGGPDNYPTASGLRPGGHDLTGVSDLDYRRFDLDYADSNAAVELFKKTKDSDCFFKLKTFGRANAPSRFAEWKREFDLMLQKDPTGGAVPTLTLLRLGNDHTSGMKMKKHSPMSMVADNDYAIGEVVEAISHSPIWNSSAICVIEDDAQSGEDHVDAHRTTAYVISPWIKANSVDHRFYNTDSMLKTMELLLGIGPMTQYEAIASAIDDWDSTLSNAAPYDAIAPEEELVPDLNPDPADLTMADPRRRLVELSDRMDFTRADAAPTALLNEVVWKSVRGLNSEPPARRVSNALPAGKDDDDGDDDDGK
jgi:YVTN family beta-propeller protein